MSPTGFRAADGKGGVGDGLVRRIAMSNRARLLAAAFAAALLGSPAFGASVTWDGGGADENWSTPGNWSGDTVPGTGDSVVVDGTSTNSCTIDGNVEVASLRMLSGYMSPFPKFLSVNGVK
jgi:hypothetical protein